jgi:hypothetical protein
MIMVDLGSEIQLALGLELVVEASSTSSRVVGRTRVVSSGGGLRVTST